LPNLERFDVAILAALQADCKLSLAEIASRAGLTPSPCWRRIKALEAAGVIDRQVAILNARKVGLNALAYVHVSLIDHREQSIARFNEFVTRDDRVIECASITGEYDYVLKVVAEDPEALEAFLMKELLATGLVRATTTNFVLRRVKSRSALPLRPTA